MKVMTVVGTRPELIKLCRVVVELDRHFDHQLIHTGQNFDDELNAVFFRELDIRSPDRFLAAAGQTAAQTIAAVIARIDDALAELKPDAFVVLGDTNSCLSAIAAKRRKIPIFHLEAGNRCFDQRVPEETNRKIIDHISDINLVFSEHARRHLLAEGIRPDTIVKTGSPMKEVLAYYTARIEASDAIERLQLDAGKFFLVSAHREENVDSAENFKNLLASLHALAVEHGLPIVVSTHPRTRKRLDALGGPAAHALVRFLKPLGFPDYVKLQKSAVCVLSDSGTLTEESSILGFPAVAIRQAHERPEGMDEGTLVMSGLSPEKVVAAVKMTMAHFLGKERPFRLIADYDADNVSSKVARIIASYVEYVNRTVWYR